MGKFVRHEPCPHCGSSDAAARYVDEQGNDSGLYCWSCNKGVYPKDEPRFLGAADRQEHFKAKMKGLDKPIVGHVEALDKRGIKEETCKKFHYEVGDYGGKQVQIANYRNDVGRRVAQKLRFADKKFMVLGDGKRLPLYGQWLWGSGGKSVVITEGEIDCLSMAQAFDLKFPVVSLPNGAAAADRDVGNALEWLLTFDKVFLCFDMDKVGREAIEKVCKVLPPEKVKVMNLPCKDANDTLLKRGPGELVKCYWNARDYRPDGIVGGDEITVERLKKAVATGLPLPYPKLDKMLMGLRKREITLLTAGTGIGKSTLARELAYHLAMAHGQKIGNVYLEEGIDKTAQGYLAIHYNVPLFNVRANPELLTDEQYEDGIQQIIRGRMWFYDHFGSLESGALLTKLRFLATVCKVDFIVLDHISIVVSGVESSQGERKDIDVLMTRLRSLVEETGVGVIAICHLNQPDGTPHEEGGRVTLRNLRGSGGLKQLSDNVVALERDQQGENRNRSEARVLKCRETGETGEADALNYNSETGRLLLAPDFEPETEQEEEAL